MKLTAESILKEHPILAEKKLYLAISGGVDSSVLLDLLLQLDLKPHLLHVNFKLRGAEANADEEFVKGLAKENNLQFSTKSFDAYAASEEFRLTIQETARKLRYDWFEEIVEQNSIILTAHHLNDSFETFFINLLRGTGLKGLTGIPESRGNIYRPLLHVSKLAICNYAEEKNVKWREDSSNSIDKYLRNKVRHDIIPRLEELGNGIYEKMDATFTELREADELIKSMADKWLAENVLEQRVKLNIVHSTNDYLLRMAFRKMGIKRSNFSAFKDFLSSRSGSIFQTKTHLFAKTHEALSFKEEEGIEVFSETIENIPCTLEVHNQTMAFKYSDKVEIDLNIQQLDRNTLELPLTLRSPKEGDRITPLGMKGSKLISRIFIDHKLSAFEKEDQLVLADATDSPIAILGLCISEKHKIQKKTNSVLEIKISKL